MSYDLEVAVKVEGCDKYAVIGIPELHNPTYNLRDMFVACTGWDFEQGEYYKCSEVIDKIKHGIKELTFRGKEYEKYDSPNGWGTTCDALEGLVSLWNCILNKAEEIPMDCLYVRW